MNNNYENFMDKLNIELLWEILLETMKIDIKNNQNIENIKVIFNSNLNMFLNPNMKIFNLNLIEINKYFLTQLINAINILIPNINNNNLKKININEEIENIPYKIEDIQNLRISNFEREYELKKNDFKNFINIKKPKEINFNIEINENKITEMESLISETIKQRNYDTETIKNIYEINNNNKINNEVNNNIIDKQKKVKFNNIEENIQGNIEENIQGNIEENIQGNIEENIQGNIEENIQGNIEENIQGNIEENIQGNIEENYNLKNLQIFNKLKKKENYEINNLNFIIEKIEILENNNKLLNEKIENINNLLEKLLLKKNENNEENNENEEIINYQYDDLKHTSQTSL